MVSLVIVLLQIVPWFWQWKTFENRLISDEVKAYKIWCQFYGANFSGHPVCLRVCVGVIQRFCSSSYLACSDRLEACCFLSAFFFILSRASFAVAGNSMPPTTGWALTDGPPTLTVAPAAGLSDSVVVATRSVDDAFAWVQQQLSK